jgi:ABC-type branched-subunit amino acid transport system permease subunit
VLLDFLAVLAQVSILDDNMFIRPATRLKIGWLFIALSALSFVVFWIVSVDESITQGHTRIIGSGSSGGVHWVAMESDSKTNMYYVIPIILCGAIGILCLAWPHRKPPKLTTPTSG